MKHPTNLNIELTPEQLGRAMATLRYDALVATLRVLSSQLKEDSVRDRERGRPRLASSLQDAGEQIQTAVASLERAWWICAKHEGL